MGSGLKVIWNKTPKVLLTKQGILVLDVFEGNLELDARSMIHAINTGLVVIPGGMTSQSEF
jgi:hypothetical protein